MTDPMCTGAEGSNTLVACCGKLQGCTSMTDMAGSYLGTAVGRQAERAVLEAFSFWKWPGGLSKKAAKYLGSNCGRERETNPSYCSKARFLPLEVTAILQ